jgi:hypothetical protein
MRERAAKVNSARSVFALLTIAAWFCLSNHCALGMVRSPSDAVLKASGCPMHSAPAKKKPAAKTPCCKDVRAVVAKWVSATALAARPIVLRDYAPEIFPPVTRVAIQIDGLDTGPPGSFSFAESVLQESMLAHAPPVS